MNTFKSLFWILILSFLSPLSYGQSNLDIASKHMKEQEYSEAFALYEDCAEKDTLAYNCLENAGLAAARMGDMSNAKNYFHKLENNEDHYKLACIQLASIYEQQENLPKAIKYNTRLRDSFPENALYHRKLGGLMKKANLPNEAFPHYAIALRLNPRDVITIGGISEIFMANNQYREADSLLNKGLTIDSTNISLRYLLARNYYKQKEYDSTAMVLLNLRGWVDFSNYYNKMLGYSLLQIDSIDLSIKYLRKSLVDEGDPEYAHYYLGTAYELKGDIESAIFHLKKAIDAGISKGTDLYYRNLARIEKGDNNLKDAIKSYDWAYRLKKDPVLLFYLADASDKYYKDKSIAINYYTRYIKSKHEEESYKKYSRERVRYLKEMQHQRKIR